MVRRIFSAPNTSTTYLVRRSFAIAGRRKAETQQASGQQVADGLKHLPNARLG